MIFKAMLGSSFSFSNAQTNETESADFKYTIYSHEREKIGKYYDFCNNSFEKFLIVEEEIDRFEQDDYKGYKFRVLVVKNFYLEESKFTEADNKKFEEFISVLENEWVEGSPLQKQPETVEESQESQDIQVTEHKEPTNVATENK